MSGESQILTAHFNRRWGVLADTIELKMPDGEIISGEVQVDRSSAPGHIFGAAYGTTGEVAGWQISEIQSWMIARLKGSRGASMRCEFMNIPLDSNVHGACRTDSRALYRIEYD